MPSLGRVALLAGDLGSAAALPAAQALVALHSWDAFYAVQDAAQPSIGPQVHVCDCCGVLFCFTHINCILDQTLCGGRPQTFRMHAVCISEDWHAALTGNKRFIPSAITNRAHFWRLTGHRGGAGALPRGQPPLLLLSFADASDKRLAADLDGFQRLVSAAHRAGCRFQHTHISALARPQPPGIEYGVLDLGLVTIKQNRHTGASHGVFQQVRKSMHPGSRGCGLVQGG